MSSSIYRDFTRYYPNECDSHIFSYERVGDVGGIHIDLVAGNRLFVTILGLHDNGCHYFPVDVGGQAMVRVTIGPTIDLYSAINTVLNKITEDHTYHINNPYKDFVLCSEELVKKIPHLCHENGNGDGTNMGGKWTYFTRETLAYVEIEGENEEDWSKNRNGRIYIDGRVNIGNDGRLEFIYDYPIISNSVEPRYYELTRGKRVTEIKYPDFYPENKEEYDEFINMNQPEDG
jgi:hypothetical protein